MNFFKEIRTEEHFDINNMISINSVTNYTFLQNTSLNASDIIFYIHMFLAKISESFLLGHLLLKNILFLIFYLIPSWEHILYDMGDPSFV